MYAPARESYAEIDLAAFRWNIQQIQNHVRPAGVAAVVKANAYGHGAEKLAGEAVKSGVAYLCVALVEEGMQLRGIDDKIPILVLIPPLNSEIEYALKAQLELSVSSYANALDISRCAQRLGTDARIHVKVNTGMHRMGIFWERTVEELQKIRHLPGIVIKGIYTHFADADSLDLAFTYAQIENFKSVLLNLPFKVPVVHAANSAGTLRVSSSFFDMVRPGQALYGFYPSFQWRSPLTLKPVMAIKSYVAEVWTVKAPQGIGYSLTYKIHEPTKIAAVPVGYADGINRRFSNNGYVLIQGRRYPIAGRVAMDWLVADTGYDSTVRQGDEVVLMGRQGDEEVTIFEWADRLKTIPLEVSCCISSRMPRKYINETD